MTPTNITKTSIIVSMIILASLAGIAWIALNDRDFADTPVVLATPTPSLTPLPMVTSLPRRVSRTHLISATTSGVFPRTLTIRAGDTVVFANDTDTPFWPVTSTAACAGLDARRGLVRGERYTLVFPTAVRCAYYDYLTPGNYARQGVVAIP